MSEHRFNLQLTRNIWVCGDSGCHELIWREKNGKERPLTSLEVIDAIVEMMQQTAIIQAMTIIHGRERGQKRAMEVLGYA